MSTVKTMPSQAKKPRISRVKRTFVNSTKNLNRYRRAVAETSLQATKRVTLELYKGWHNILRSNINPDRLLRQFLEVMYPAPRKIRGVQPSQRLRKRWDHFRYSIGIMWHNAEVVNQEAQAFAQAS